MNPGKAIQNKINGVKQNFADYKKLDSKDKKTYWKEQCLIHPADRSNYLHLHPELQFPVGGFHCQHYQPVRSEPSHCLWYCGMYRIDRY